VRDPDEHPTRASGMDSLTMNKSDESLTLFRKERNEEAPVTAAGHEVQSATNR